MDEPGAKISQVQQVSVFMEVTDYVIKESKDKREATMAYHTIQGERRKSVATFTDQSNENLYPKVKCCTWAQFLYIGVYSQ
jgi:hypothetical protein